MWVVSLGVCVCGGGISLLYLGNNALAYNLFFVLCGFNTLSISHILYFSGLDTKHCSERTFYDILSFFCPIHYFVHLISILGLLLI